ncbi:uncharacterized protein PHALS_14958 [Plasmopara halstedii]|uniref:Uncharacterized protein n=1 Tax=Plasmopara halstedii TaxID=4781 RepID=A0A0N7L7H3_PLAHL|nr:uncharacterized protein PHALS_14958 [Plasmopara halstedii]CEG47075.1 hypothetical protein PHALS_14958 [Plasmopara halstedii]|eukprot:XP_024583444.1 hypothetical protein PHALS_14958 [Plasmopara halstedii]
MFFKFYFVPICRSTGVKNVLAAYYMIAARALTNIISSYYNVLNASIDLSSSFCFLYSIKSSR